MLTVKTLDSGLFKSPDLDSRCIAELASDALFGISAWQIENGILSLLI